jgi:hypothetical protein
MKTQTYSTKWYISFEEKSLTHSSTSLLKQVLLAKLFREMFSKITDPFED